MSEIQVNKIIPATGTDVTLGDSGDTFTVPSGATIANSGTATGFGGGGLLQIKQTILTTGITQAGTNGTWFDATGLSVDITPTLSTSKILVNVCITIAGGASGGAGEQYQIVRDSTAIAIATDASGNRTNTTAGCAFDGIGGNYNHTRAMMFIDAPATTSATTYKVQIGGETSYSVYVNRSGANSDVAYQGNCASTITVMELAVGVL